MGKVVGLNADYYNGSRSIKNGVSVKIWDRYYLRYTDRAYTYDRKDLTLLEKAR